MPTYDNDNVFAKILRGELPCVKVYEDDHTLAFMDVMPQTDGHTLVIPKTPSVNMLDIAAEDAEAVMHTTLKLARAVKEAMQASGVQLMQLNGAAAGQTVFHTHFHIIPREDGVEMRFHAKDMADPAELEKHAAKIRAAL
ncbi:MAG: HIT family protein [Parvibaculales bacterium]